jgi:VCBS repeat-containing protein
MTIVKPYGAGHQIAITYPEQDDQPVVFAVDGQPVPEDQFEQFVECARRA